MPKYLYKKNLSPELILGPIQLVEVPGEVVTVGTVLGEEGSVEVGAPGSLTDEARPQVDSPRDEGKPAAVRLSLGIHRGSTVDIPG